MLFLKTDGVSGLIHGFKSKLSPLGGATFVSEASREGLQKDGQLAQSHVESRRDRHFCS